jgi:hypothetical protein
MSRLEGVRRVAKRLVADEWITIDNSIDGEAPFKEVGRILKERSASRSGTPATP